MQWPARAQEIFQRLSRHEAADNPRQGRKDPGLRTAGGQLRLGRAGKHTLIARTRARRIKQRQLPFPLAQGSADQGFARATQAAFTT